jgi:hypothetical protein
VVGPAVGHTLVQRVEGSYPEGVGFDCVERQNARKTEGAKRLDNETLPCSASYPLRSPTGVWTEGYRVVAANAAARYRSQSTPGVRVLCRKHLLYNSSSAAFSWGSATSAGPSATATPEATPVTVETATLAPVINRGIHPDRRRLRRRRRRGVCIAAFYAGRQGCDKPPPVVRAPPQRVSTPRRWRERPRRESSNGERRCRNQLHH